MALATRAAKSDPKASEREQILRDLAQDIVKNIEEVPDILNKFGISHDEYLRLAETTPFRNMLREAATEWNSAAKTQDRIKLKSALLVEQALPEMYGALLNKNEPLNGRVELLKTLGKFGELGIAPVDGGAKGNTFRLEINFNGSPERNIVVEHAALTSEVIPPNSEFADANDELM